MGTEIGKSEFSAEDHAAFRERLDACMTLMRETLARPGFGKGEPTLGAELELYLVDEAGCPAPRNTEALAALGDPRFTPELNRFNLEYNAPHTAVAGEPFSVLEGHLQRAFARLARLEEALGAHAIPVGILPSLKRGDLHLSAISDLRRYHALNQALRALRGEDFHFHIDGLDPLVFESPDVSPEGAATSWQWHLRVDPAEFQDVYNAAQLTLPLVVALAGNSPLFSGHRLWHETRIAIFKQAVDVRPIAEVERPSHARARVAFGEDWLDGGFAQLFADKIEHHAPLLPECHRHPPEEDIEIGGAPRLHELRLHGSTVWLWNRPVYDPIGGGHVRLEQRALPAGPTVRDMLANTAFSLGLIASHRQSRDWERLPFALARDNFYRAGQHGIEAVLAWPSEGEPERVPARELASRLLPRAREGPLASGVAEREADRHLAPIAGRMTTGQTGAVWQLDSLEALERDRSRADALPALVRRYAALSQSGRPAHEWPVAT